MRVDIFNDLEALSSKAPSHLLRFRVVDLSTFFLGLSVGGFVLDGEATMHFSDKEFETEQSLCCGEESW